MTSANAPASINPMGIASDIMLMLSEKHSPQALRRDALLKDRGLHAVERGCKAHHHAEHCKADKPPTSARAPTRQSPRP